MPVPVISPGGEAVRSLTNTHRFTYSVLFHSPVNGAAGNIQGAGHFRPLHVATLFPLQGHLHGRIVLRLGVADDRLEDTATGGLLADEQEKSDALLLINQERSQFICNDSLFWCGEFIEHDDFCGKYGPRRGFWISWQPGRKPSRR